MTPCLEFTLIKSIPKTLILFLINTLKKIYSLEKCLNIKEKKIHMKKITGYQFREEVKFYFIENCN